MGGSNASAPQPTQEETDLQRYQLALMQSQQAENDAMRPVLLAQMGYKQVPRTVSESTIQGGNRVYGIDPNRITTTAPQYTQLSDGGTELAAPAQTYYTFDNGASEPVRYDAGGKYIVLTPDQAVRHAGQFKTDKTINDIVAMTAEERAAAMTPEQKLDLELKMKSVDLATQGADYNKRILALMEKGYDQQSAIAQAQLELQQGQIESQKKSQGLTDKYIQKQLDALEGKLPISPALEAELAKQKETLTTDLSARLGPNWMLSTPGIQTMAQFEKNAELTREEARRGQIATGQGLVNSGLNGSQPSIPTYPNYVNSPGVGGGGNGGGGGGGVSQTMQYPNNYGLIDRTAGLLQPYQAYNTMGFNANVQNSQMATARQNAYIGGGAAIAGSALAAYATYAGLAAGAAV